MSEVETKTVAEETKEVKATTVTAKKKGMSVKDLATLGLLTGVLLLMAFTPLGYFHTFGLDISLMMIPVGIGAMLMGPKAGAWLGFIFGATSFYQAVTGASPFSAMLFSISPLHTFLLCIPTRILMGFLTGVIFLLVSKLDKKKTVCYFDDYAKVEEQIGMLKDVFATTDDIATVVDNNSDVPYEDVYVAVSAMPTEMKAFVEGAKVGDATEPAFANDTYTMYRLMGTKTAPDSITVQIASFPMGDNSIDSVYNAVVAGAEFGADVNVMNDFVVTEDMYAGLGRNFVADVFAAGNGYFKTSSLGGVQHIAKVVKRSTPVAKAKVATLTIAVVPSVDTETELYNNLSSYVAKYNTVDQFADSAFVAGYTTVPAECQAEQTSVSGIQNSRQIIHWAFNAKKGEVSEIYEIDDRYVVAMLEKVTKEGYRPMEELENLLNTTVRRNKKSQAIAQQLSAVSPATIEAYAQAMNTKVDTVKFVSVASPSIAGLGYEPVVAGAASGLEMGETSAPVAGNRGVYVLQVVNENAASRPYNEQAEMNRLEQQYMSVANQFIEVLKEKADIENTLVRFF